MEGDSFPPGPKLKRVITNCKYCNNGVCKNDENSNNYDDICPGDCSYYYRKWFSLWWFKKRNLGL